MLRSREFIHEIISGVVANSFRSRSQLLVENACGASKSSTCNAYSNDLA